MTPRSSSNRSGAKWGYSRNRSDSYNSSCASTACRMTTDLLDRLRASLATTYDFERELGGGGMSRVFVAGDTRLGRKIVVKVLNPELAEGISAQRFEREIQIAARLQHPNIVPVLSTGESEGLPFYTMPFVRGESLRTQLASGRMDTRTALRLLATSNRRTS